MAKKQTQETTEKRKRFGAPVPFQVVSEADVPAVAWGERLCTNVSPYVIALQQLDEGPAGTVLSYASAKAVASLKRAAKKLGFKILFAHQANSAGILVKIVGYEDDAE